MDWATASEIVNFFTGVISIKDDWETMWNPNATPAQRGIAVLDFGMNIIVDASMVDGLGELARATRLTDDGDRLLTDLLHTDQGACEEACHTDPTHSSSSSTATTTPATTSGAATTTTTTSATDVVTQDASGLSHDVGEAPPSTLADVCSFSAATEVATPAGEQAIGSLQVGDAVEAYNPQTGQSEPEPVQHVWVNHDSDLVDVRLNTAPSATSTRATTHVTAQAGGHGWLVDTASSAVHLTTNQQTANVAAGETIHTTANHPWLTADRGWVAAGQLTPGEQIVPLNGGTSMVAWVHAVAGQADMYNLTVANDHTYAVGAGQAVVHNTDCMPTNYPVLANAHAQEVFNQVSKSWFSRVELTVGVAYFPEGESAVRYVTINESGLAKYGADVQAAEAAGDRWVSPITTAAHDAHAEDTLQALGTTLGPQPLGVR